MSKVIFRFYEELNEFLPKQRRKKDFQVDFEGRRSLKDMIEALGVPHTEIDLILVNGKSVNFAYVLQDWDRVSVYPVYECLNIENVTRLRKVPLRKTKFIADIHLGDIVKYMRALGFDVCFDPSLSTRKIIEISKQKSRIILTKSRQLLKFKEVTHAIFIRPGTTAEQIKGILDYLDIKDRIKPFSRCLCCNSVLKNVSKESIAERIPPKTKELCDQYTYCKFCDKVYWRGTHFIKMNKAIDHILSD